MSGFSHGFGTVYVPQALNFRKQFHIFLGHIQLPQALHAGVEFSYSIITCFGLGDYHQTTIYVNLLRLELSGTLVEMVRVCHGCFCVLIKTCLCL